ncbi:MAG: carboxymuconolactone decarboxylase family protein [Ignavibacteriales bacterium]|nr:carboxymuconolactone decarboxylase family protein [Ignavibacteriales bacterium]
MQRIKALNPDTATGDVKNLFDAVTAKLGMVPNMMRTMGNSPAVLNGYLSLSGALSEGTIGGKLGEQIALLVAELNKCEYCLSAHTFIGTKLLGLDSDVAQSSRTGKTPDVKINSALAFAKTLVEKRGIISDSDLAAVRSAGYSDGEIGEIVAHVALNIFTNYFNNTAKTVIDFPKIELYDRMAA